MKVYSGVDLHARSSQVCVIDGDGKVLLNRKVANLLEEILGLLEPFEAPIPIAVESTFNWYWLVDGLQDAGHDVHLGHPFKLALITRAKVKTDRRDALALARLLRSGDFPEAYIYPRQTRPIRDLVRQRGKLVTWRAREYGALRLRLYRHGILDHSRSTPRAITEEELEALFDDPRVFHLIQLERARIQLLSRQIIALDHQILRMISHEDGYQRLRQIPGLGDALAPVVILRVRRHPPLRLGQALPLLLPSRPRRCRVRRQAQGASRTQAGQPPPQVGPHPGSGSAIRYRPNIRRVCDRHMNRRRGRGRKPIARNTITHKLGLATYYVLKEGTDYDHTLIFGN